MASLGTRQNNTPAEIWKKVLNTVTDVKMNAAETGDQRNLLTAVEVETMILDSLRQPLEEMGGAGGGGMGGPPMGGDPMMGGGMPAGPMADPGMGPGMLQPGPGDAAGLSMAPMSPSSGRSGGLNGPNPDELRRALSK